MTEQTNPPFNPNSRKFLYKDSVPVEMWAVSVSIIYDPTVRKAVVNFGGQGMTIVNGTPLVIPSITDNLHSDLSDMATRCFGYGLDPVTGADLSQVSVAGLDRIISCAYDTLHNERALATPSNTAATPVAPYEPPTEEPPTEEPAP